MQQWKSYRAEGTEMYNINLTDEEVSYAIAAFELEAEPIMNERTGNFTYTFQSDTVYYIVEYDSITDTYFIDKEDNYTLYEDYY